MKFDTVGSDEGADGYKERHGVRSAMCRLLVPEVITNLSLFLKFVGSGQRIKEA
jgi:hypothetical protein